MPSRPRTPHALGPAAATLQLGGKTPDQIRALAEDRYDFHPDHVDWLRSVADALGATGAASLGELTPDQLRDVLAA